MALLRSVATVGSYTAVSRVFGFIRDVLTAAILGAGPIADAFFVAQLRAAEAAQARPFYRDSVVPLFLGPETKAAAARFSKAFPPIEKTIRLRTRYFDDRLDEQLS